MLTMLCILPKSVQLFLLVVHVLLYYAYTEPNFCGPAQVSPVCLTVYKQYNAVQFGH